MMNSIVIGDYALQMVDEDTFELTDQKTGKSRNISGKQLTQILLKAHREGAAVEHRTPN